MQSGPPPHRPTPPQHRLQQRTAAFQNNPLPRAVTVAALVINAGQR